jgi:hypothetical protein
MDGFATVNGSYSLVIKSNRSLDMLAAHWLSRNVEKYKECEDHLCVSQQRILCAEVGSLGKLEMTEGREDIAREFIAVDENGTALFGEGKEMVMRGRLVLLLEVKRLMKKRKREQIESSTFKKKMRVSTTVHESRNDRLRRLQNIYVFAHKEESNVYTRAGHTEKKCCISGALYHKLGCEAEAELLTDADALDGWVLAAKRELLLCTLRNLFWCNDARLYKYRIDADPERATDIDPALRDELRRREANGDAGLSDEAFEACKAKQVEINVILIARSLRWFAGKGVSPKFRAQFYNWQTKKTTSGKAAPPWYLILDAFEMNMGAIKSGDPIRTPVTIARDRRDDDIEDLLVALEADPRAVCGLGDVTSLGE